METNMKSHEQIVRAKLLHMSNTQESTTSNSSVHTQIMSMHFMEDGLVMKTIRGLIINNSQDTVQALGKTVGVFGPIDPLKVGKPDIPGKGCYGLIAEEENINLLLSLIKCEKTVDVDKLVIAACKEGNERTVVGLIHHPGSIPIDALKEAILGGHVDAMAVLIDDGRVDINYGDGLLLALACGLTASGPLHEMIMSDKIDISANKNVALRMACSNGWSDVVRRIINHPKFDARQLDMVTLMSILSQYPNAAIFEALVTNPVTKDLPLLDGLLITASGEGWYETTTLILGGLTNVSKEAWKYALEAATRSSLKILRVLLDDSRCNSGSCSRYLLSIAKKENRVGAIKVLVRHPNIRGAVKLKGYSKANCLEAADVIIRAPETPIPAEIDAVLRKLNIKSVDDLCLLFPHADSH